MKNVLLAAAAIGLSLSTSAAMAQSANGFYVRAGGGAALGTDLTFTDVNSADPNAVLGPGGTLKASTDPSVLVLAGIGYKFSPLFWADITGLWLPDMSFSDGNTNIVLLQNGTGKIYTLTGMLNGYVDVARLFGLPLSSVQPYVMGSGGYSRNHIGTISGTVPVVGVTGASFTGGTHYNFAWGAGAGVGIALGSHFSIDVGYEYLDLGQVRTGGTGTLTFTAGSPITATAGSMKADLKVHTVQVSMRYGF